MDLTAASSLVLESVAAFDQVTVWLPRLPPKELRRAVLQHCAKRARWCDGTKSRGKNEKGNERVRYLPVGDRVFWARAQLTCPSRLAMDLLVREFGEENVYVNKVEIALDLVCRSATDAEYLAAFLRAHAIKRWHARGTVHHVNGVTSYYESRSSRRNLVIYGDRESKVRRAPCAHIEYRLGRVDAVRACGIQSVANMATFDHRSYWKRNLLLLAPDLESVGRIALGKTRDRRHWRRTFPGGLLYDYFLRHGSRLFRFFAADPKQSNCDSELQAQRFLDRYGKALGLSRTRGMVELDNSALLPTSNGFLRDSLVEDEVINAQQSCMTSLTN